MTALTEELKGVRDEILDLVQEFQKKNDERLDAVEKDVETRVGDGLVNEVTETINEKLGERMDDFQKLYEELDNRVAEASRQATMLARLHKGGDVKMPLDEMAAKFSRVLSRERNSEIVMSIDQMEAYCKAQEQYWRFGDKDIRIANELSVGSDPDGGYWVTPDTSGRIVELIYESSPMRQVANIETVGTDALEGDLDLDEAGSGWVGEREARPETTTPGIGEYRIPVHEQYAMPITTQKVLDDADRDIEGWLNGKVSSKLTRTENAAFTNGTGQKQPRGFLTYGAGTPTATAWNVIQQVKTGKAGAFADTDPGDALIDVLMALKVGYLANARWMMRRLTFAEVRKLKDGQGNYLFAVSFNESGLGLNLLGYPITLGEDMPAIGAGALAIAVADWGEAYTIVDRMGIRILRDPFTTKGKVKFYTTKRVGGDVTNFEAIKLLDFSA